ncbi:MAG: hypothetical protein U1E63_16725 [Burkholderiales bacterium]
MYTAKSLGIVALLAIAAIHSPAFAVAADSPDRGVGVVAEYRPAAGRFNFTRAPKGDAVPVQIGSVVQAGDRLTLPAGASVSLQLSNGKSTTFNGPGSFEVPDGRPLGKLATIIASVIPMLDDEYRMAGTAASRGGESCAKDGVGVKPIEVPILAGGANIVAGERDLPLAWRGGCPPFLVRVLSGDDSVVHRESIAGWQVRLDDVPLAVGSYVVVVADAGGGQSKFDLVAVNDGPVLPPDLAADNSNLGITAQAAWLARQDDGRWRLESFERLRPLIRSGDTLAGTLGDALLWGPATRN